MVQHLILILMAEIIKEKIRVSLKHFQRADVGVRSAN